MGDYLQHPFSPTSSDSKASEGSATEESSWEGQAFAFQSSQHGKVACSPRAFRMIFPFHYSLLLNICKDIRFGWEINDDVCSWIEWSVQHPMVQILTSKITWLTTLKMQVSHAIFNTRTNQKTLVKKTVSKVTGQIQVTGIHSALRASASYPSDFGFALAALLTPQGCPSTSLDRVGSNYGFHMLSCFTRIKLIGELVWVFPY